MTNAARTLEKPNEEGAPESGEREATKVETPESVQESVERIHEQAEADIETTTGSALAYAEQEGDPEAAETIKRSDATAKKELKIVATAVLKGTGAAKAEGVVEEPNVADEADVEGPLEAVSEPESLDDEGEAQRQLEIAQLTKERHEHEETVRRIAEESERMKDRLKELMKEAPANDVRSLPPEKRPPVVALTKNIASLEKESAAATARIGEIALALVALERVAATKKVARTAEQPRHAEKAERPERSPAKPVERVSAGAATEDVKKPHAMKRVAKNVGMVGAVGVAGGLLGIAGISKGLAWFFNILRDPKAAWKRLGQWWNRFLNGDGRKGKEKG